jgi:acyl carrier protein
MNNIELKTKEVLLSVRPDLDFNDDVNYIENGDFDSFDIITIVSELDNKFTIKISGLDVLPENFINLISIVNLVRKYIK